MTQQKSQDSNFSVLLNFKPEKDRTGKREYFIHLLKTTFAREFPIHFATVTQITVKNNSTNKHVYYFHPLISYHKLL